MPDTQEKIRIFKSCFSGLQNVYGTYDIKTGKVRQVKEPVTDNVIHNHLTGRQSYGVYLLTSDKTASLAVDFDQDDLTVPIAFAAGAKQYDISAYIERSKSKGYHVWIFFEESGVLARKARIVAAKILTDIGKDQTEVFPKQDVLANGISYGNFINAPLFGVLVPKGRTVFVDTAEPGKVYPDQWELLASVLRVSEHKLDAIIENCRLDEQSVNAKKEIDSSSSYPGIGTLSFGLPPCGRRILAEGVDSYQRVLCFRLAVHLKRNGLPFDLALAVLKAWAKKNHPSNGKGIITDQEVEHQTRCAFDNSYRSLGCEDPAVAAYCDKACPLYSYKTGKYSA
ncbi:MAG: hypothetical protein BWY69_01393 [Planctomycetes bacterium ADurb.Bin401]|nr:MAG: hypothetical protein BWY69_01393 [Planctomycetes bacterium ADurb.Bin401]